MGWLLLDPSLAPLTIKSLSLREVEDGKYDLLNLAAS